MFDILMELDKNEIESYTKIQVFPKDEFHPKEITSLVLDKISSNRKKLEKFGYIYAQINRYNAKYIVKIFSAEFDYDYTIIWRHINE